jgi:peptidyl-prolyl cis-trans isomerase A (cyclophilin A)
MTGSSPRGRPHMRSLSSPLSLMALLVLVAGCAPRSAGVGPVGPEAPPNPLLDPGAPEMNLEAPDRFKVLFETSAGDFVLEVERALAPLGADRFYNLVRSGYYEGTRFFRVVPGFVVQWGLSGDPEVAAAWRGARIEDDPVVGSNTRGTITFAMGGPGTRTVQVYINLGDNSRLDDTGFAPFGRVTGGMDVVEALYGGYGDGAPRGQGPEQGRITSEGDAYLEAEFPELDRVERVTIIREERDPRDPREEGEGTPEG